MTSTKSPSAHSAVNPMDPNSAADRQLTAGELLRICEFVDPSTPIAVRSPIDGGVGSATYTANLYRRGPDGALIIEAL